MSMLPYVINELMNDERDPFSRICDQHFGVGLWDDDLLLSRPSWTSIAGPLRSGYVRSHRPFILEDSGISSISNEKDRVKINLDVQQFKPEEVTVKIVDDYLIVEGKHEEKEDKHGYVSRQFSRRYKLPDNILQEKITSTISSDGVLSVVAPKKPEAIAQSKEREIPITRTNEPAIKHKKSGEREKMES